MFYNNTTKNDQKAQLTVRHLAAAPPVDTYLNGTIAFPGLANPTQAEAFLAPGTYTGKMTTAGKPSVVVMPATPFTMTARTNTIVYAVGAFPGSFTVIVEVLAMS